MKEKAIPEFLEECEAIQEEIGKLGDRVRSYFTREEVVFSTIVKDMDIRVIVKPSSSILELKGGKMVKSIECTYLQLLYVLEDLIVVEDQTCSNFLDILEKFS